MSETAEETTIPEHTDIDSVVEMVRGLLERYPQAAPSLIQLFGTIETKLQALTAQALRDVQATLQPTETPEAE